MEVPPNPATPEAPTEETPRNPLGWILLVLLFAGLITLSLANYFQRPKTGGSGAVATNELRLRSWATSFRNDADGKKILEEINRDREKSVRARKLAVVAQFEVEGKANPADVAALAKADAAAKTFARLYQAEKLTPTEADRLKGEIKGDGTTADLARRHADKKAGREIPPMELPMVLLVLMGTLFVASIGGVALWISYGAARAAKAIAPMGHPAEPLTPAESDNFALRTVQLMALFVVLPLLVKPLLGGLVDPVGDILYGLLLLGLTIFALRFAVNGVDISARRIGIRRERLGINILIGIAGTMMTYPVLVVTMLFSSSVFRGLPPPEHPLGTELQGTSSIAVILNLVFLAAVVAPVFEEIVFRGILFPALSRALRGPVLGALASSFLFASIHPQGIPAWLALASVGAIACMLTQHTRSLVPAIVMHSLYNFSLVLLNLTINR